MAPFLAAALASTALLLVSGTTARADLGPACDPAPGMRITGSGLILGTPGDDRITGSPGPDVIRGFGGNDKVDGLAGDDIVYGGACHDTLLGGAGADTLLGEGGNDNLAGSADGAVDIGDGGDGRNICAVDRPGRHVSRTTDGFWVERAYQEFYEGPLCGDDPPDEPKP
jgi:Ca2+-binding RTX toxin-like protein